MSPSEPINIKVQPRHAHFEGSQPYSSSYLATSPLAQEILARDIEECSTEDEEEYSDDGESILGRDEPKRSRRDAHFHAADPASLAFHPQSITYGTSRPQVAPQHHGREQSCARSVREIEQSRNAERSLLRDNHILPPKHPRRAGQDSPLRRLYRWAFSTKVRDGQDHEYDYGYGPRPVSSKAVETTPLLVSVEEMGPPTPNEAHNRWEAAVAANVLRTTWQREAKTLVQYSAPLIVTFLLHYAVTVGSVLNVGRIGVPQLAAVNLAAMTANVTCYIPVQGLATCLDTLCSQAYGSGHKHLVGLQAQRMTFLLWLLLIPIAALWLCAEPILTAIVPDAETAHLAAMYLRILVLGTPGVAAFESGKRFVQSQGMFHATTYVLMIGAPLSFVQNWLFVWKMDMGFLGAAVAMAVTQNLLPILLALYVYLVEGRECWNGFSRRAFTNWGPMLRLAVPGMIMIEAQFSVLEGLTLAAGQFGKEQLAAQSVIITTTALAFNIPFPLSIAASTRVANLIGATLVDAARTTAKVALSAGLLVGIFNLTILSVFRESIPRIFTNNEEVAGIVSQVLVVCAVLQIFDALAAVSHGLLRGIGRQTIGGYTNLFSYYFVALPVALSTAFTLGWKLAGLWFGITSGLAVVTIIELIYLYHADLDYAVEQARDRMLEDQGHAPEFK